MRVFGGLLASIVATVVLIIVTAGIDPMIPVAIGVLGVLGFLGSIALAWVLLFRVAKALDRAARAWLAGEVPGAIAEVQAALPIAFRSDFRTKAYHVLGLCAEARGDFPEALELFRLSEASLPAMIAPLRRQRALVLSRCHQAIAHAALGDVAGAHAAQHGACLAFAEAQRPASWNVLLDDAAWGLGPASINHVVEGMEAGRDLRALLSLSGMRVALLVGNAHREVLGIAERERACLMAGLMPREMLLALKMEERARLALEPQYRSAPLALDADPSHLAWVERALG